MEVFTSSWEIVKANMPIAGKNAALSGSYYCSPCTESFTNVVTYYDKYNANSTQVYIPQNNSNFAPTTNQYVEGFVSTKRLNGMAVANKIRILDDNYDNLNVEDDHFLTSTTYYDERGRVIQTHSQNIKGGVDIAQVQYDYAGKVLSTASTHKLPGNEFDNFTTINKNEYDLLQRLVTTSKVYKIGILQANSVFKKLATYRYDEMGRLKTKK